MYFKKKKQTSTMLPLYFVLNILYQQTAVQTVAVYEHDSMDESKVKVTVTLRITLSERVRVK